MNRDMATSCSFLLAEIALCKAYLDEGRMSFIAARDEQLAFRLRGLLSSLDEVANHIRTKLEVR